MSASDLLPWVIGLYTFLGAAFLVALGGAFWLGRKLTRVEGSMAALGSSAETQIQLIGVVIGALRRQTTLVDADLTEIQRLYMQSSLAVIRQTVETEEQRHNPLNHDELERLKFYIAKAERGELFTHPEIQEYNQLVAKLQEDNGRVDPGVVALVGLGALLLGMWLGSRAK